MVKVRAGDLDRRITVQIDRDERDAAGDVVRQDWETVFKLWARRSPKSPGVEIPTEGGVLRQFDLIMEVRDGEKARSMAPETHRVMYKRRIYEIVGILPGVERADRINILLSARPDHRGSRGLEGVSGQP